MPPKTTFDLKRERIDRGLSQAALAEKAGVTERVIELAEARGRRPRPAAAKQLADYFDVKVSDIWPDGS